MASSILHVPSSVMLVPGATGRTDVAHDEREAVLTELRRTIAAVLVPGATTSTTPLHGVRLTVVAPAPLDGVRTTVDGTPDLGASGLLVAPGSGDVPGTLSRASQTGGESPPAAGAQRQVRLHTAASVVTVLLRLAGWRGSVRSVEVGAGAGEAASRHIDSGVLLAPGGEEPHVLVFTTLLELTDEPTGVPSAGAVPSGVSARLLRADRAVAALYRSVVASAPVI